MLWAATASCHLGYLDTLDAKHLDNTRHPLDTLDTLVPRHPRHHSSTPRHGQAWSQPRQASTGLDRPRQASTPLSLDSSSTAARHPRHRASTPRHQGSARAAVPTRVFGPPPSTELTTITYARFIVCATRSTTTAVAPRAPFQHAAMAMCSTSRHGFLRRIEARRAGT